MTGRADTPISPAELSGLFDGLESRDRLALAVSGGRDSVALMHLVARWWAGTGASPGCVTVLTVDHGLRADSGAEADQVGRLARGLGFGHAVLRWRGGKPRSGLQAAARSARYDLMAAHCHAHGIPVILTGHHLEDQAETLLMRLGRGSGVDGLSAMPRTGAWAGIEIVRPLLDVSRTRLAATLEQAGVTWIEDPSNGDDRFERVRTREALATLEALGVTADRLAATAARMRRARRALDRTTDAFLAANLELSAAGYARISAEAVGGAPEEIALRALARTLAAIGGSAAPPRLARLERLLAALRAGSAGARTLGGCRVAAERGVITIVRESGRGLPELRLAAGVTGVWDRRFRVRVPDHVEGAVAVRALTRAGFAGVRARLRTPVSLPLGVAESLAAYWRHDQVLAVPHLGYRADRQDGGSGGDGDWTAAFVNAAMLGASEADAGLIRPSGDIVTMTRGV